MSNTHTDDDHILPLGSDPTDYAALSLSRDIRAVLFREGLVDSPELPTRPITARIERRCFGPQDPALLTMQEAAGAAVRATLATGTGEEAAK